MEETTTATAYQTVMPYLIVPNAQQCLDFLRQVFQAREQHLSRRPDGQIMHAEMVIGDSTLMLAEASDQWTAQPAGLFLQVEDADTTYQLALTHGATSVMPPQDKPYGRSSGVKDPFGNTWWITSPLQGE